MEKCTRCQDTLLIKYNETNNDKYLSRKYLLEKSCLKIKNEIKLQGLDNTHLSSCVFPYNRPDEFITLCAHKGYIFVGIYNSSQKIISFNSNDSAFLLLQPSSFERIEARLISDIKNQHIERKDYVKEAWIEKIPLLDSIIELKEEINKLPEKQRDIIYHSLQYDETVNHLIESFENQDIEQDIEKE